MQPPPRPERRSIRYPGYDYSMAGYYALTLCAAGNAPLFGHLPAADALSTPPLVPTALGALVQAELLALPTHYPTLRLDTWVLMPNHLHALLVLTKNRAVGLAQVLGAFKSRAWQAWRRQCLALGQPAPPTCWHRNYYERIVRDRAELEGHRAYIAQNPARWHCR